MIPTAPFPSVISWPAPRRRRRLAGRVALYAVLLTIAAIDLFPIIWIALSSFKPQIEIFQWPPTLLPNRLTLANYAEALALLPPGERASTELPQAIRNSLLVALATTGLVLALGAPAGYGFARLEFPGRRPLLLALMSLRMLPGIVLVVPLFLLATRLHLFDTRTVLVLVYTAFTLPFAVWLLSVFFQEVPRDLEDAARVDGCSRLGLLVRIYLPLSLPAIGAVAILAFLAALNEFLFAVTLTSTVDAKTTPVALASMQAAFQTRWAVMTAGAVLLSIPALLVVAFAQRALVQGLTMGAVKG